MKRKLKKLINSLAFRIVTPVLLLQIFTGISLYLFVLSSVSDFAEKNIRDDIERLSHDIYNICNNAVDELMRNSTFNKKGATIVKKGRVLGKIEEFAGKHNLHVSIVDRAREVLLRNYDPAFFPDLKAREEMHENRIYFSDHEKGGVYFYHFHFDPWAWDLLLLKDVSEYSQILSRVKYLYGITAGTLLIAILLLFYYLRRYIQIPLKQIIDPIKENRKPEYSGIYEFEFISDNVSLMVDSLDHSRAVAEEASQAKSNFMANMSHEIRTPMNSIMGITFLALEADPSPKIREYLTKINGAAKSLLRIINDILDFSKIDAETFRIENVEFRLDDVLDKLSPLTTIAAKEKEMDVVFDIDSEIPPLLIGDPARLNQVLINLVSNAVKFSEKGEIVVSARLINKLEGAVLLRFSVTDTGAGIAADQISKLFQPFFQVDASNTRSFGGTGLGLAISKRIVENMGGKIWVESEYGRGSTFFFTIDLGFRDEQGSDFTTAAAERDNVEASGRDDHDVSPGNPVVRPVLQEGIEEYNGKRGLPGEVAAELSSTLEEPLNSSFMKIGDADRESVKPLIQELSMLIQSSNTDSEQYVGKLEEFLTMCNKTDEYKKLEKQILTYDYESAHETLEGIKGELMV